MAKTLEEQLHKISLNELTSGVGIAEDLIINVQNYSVLDNVTLELAATAREATSALVFRLEEIKNG